MATYCSIIEYHNTSYSCFVSTCPGNADNHPQFHPQFHPHPASVLTNYSNAVNICGHLCGIKSLSRGNSDNTTSCTDHIRRKHFSVIQNVKCKGQWHLSTAVIPFHNDVLCSYRERSVVEKPQRPVYIPREEDRCTMQQQDRLGFESESVRKISHYHCVSLLKYEKNPSTTAHRFPGKHSQKCRK